jgi:hypothetical protein
VTSMMSTRPSRPPTTSTMSILHTTRGRWLWTRRLGRALSSLGTARVRL